MATGAIEYDARTQGSSAPALTDVTLTLSLDCLRLDGNRAAMSGVVTDSTYAPYVGTRALMAVEDNGEGSKADRRNAYNPEQSEGSVSRNAARAAGRRWG